MSLLNTYLQNRNALNDILEYISTDEFIELPEQERRAVLERMKELVRLAAACDEGINPQH